MKRSDPVMTPEVASRVVKRLSLLRSVTQFDRSGEPQSATLTHSLTDLDKSFREFLEVLLPRLLDETLTSDQLNDVLLDIGEELRYVLYHIKDPRFFGYLLDEAPSPNLSP